LVFTSKEKGLGRMTSLLTMLGLQNRICSCEEVLLSAINGVSPIDYSFVREVLVRQRQYSSAFLRESVSKVDALR
jgi:hypothetical protein